MPSVKPPEYLYHAAPQCVEGKIKVEGLIGHPMSGGVYLATSPANCMTFMSMRLLAHVHGVKDVAVMRNGVEEQWRVPDLVMHDYAAVFKVHTSRLDLDLLIPGDDHNRVLMGDIDSWLYRGHISLDAIDEYVAHMAPVDA